MATATIRELERKIEELDARPCPPGPVASTGIDALDALLPRGGLPRGQVVEWVGARSSGKTALLCAALARIRAGGESVALIDVGRTLYAPAWLALAGPPGRFWVVRPRTPGEAAWCADLLLRCGAFGAVVLELGPGTPAAGGSGGTLRRSAAVRLGRLAEEAGALFVALGEVPLAALRLRFRPGRVEPVRGGPFGPILPAVRPVWVRVGKGGLAETPVLCPGGLVRSTGHRRAVV